MIDSYVKTKNGKERIKAYLYNEVPLPILSFNKLQRNHKIIKYATDFMCLDTEKSHDSEERGWIYQWAVKLKNQYIYGRTPGELIELLIRIAERYKLKDDKRILCYIHNAAYDLQYLKHYLRKYDPNTHFFVIDSHSIIICDCLGFRFLCSYKLTNLSLNALAKNYASTYSKAVGEIDYNIVRYQDTELNQTDWFYMFSDVASQMDGIEGYLRAMGYRYAYNAPVTSTGFVRVDCRNESKKDPEWREEFLKGRLTYEMYNLCRWGFMGGVCICNCFYSGQTLRDTDYELGFGHEDFRSSYPAQQMMNYFPEGAPSWYGEVECMEEFEDLLQEYCCVFELTLTNAHIRPGITAPCIPSSKCIGLESPVRLNGKIVYAQKLTIAITEIDYKWIRKQYTADAIQVSNLLVFKRGKTPEWFRRAIMKYFTAKCTLKKQDPLLYAKSKAHLNAIYGMTATSLIRDEYEADDDVIFYPKQYDDPKAAEEAKKKQLSKYYSSFNNFMPYQYSLYTTAWARDALFTMIETVGYKNFLYCDTDSVFYIKTSENIKAMEEYRKACKKRAIEAGAYVGEYYLGEPTPEPPIRAFRGLHSKCYAMEELNEDTNEYELKVVIAGIPKKSIYWENGEAKEITNSEELKTIDNLYDGFVFEHNGGTRCIYNEQLPEVVQINGHVTQVSSSAIIQNISKEISNTMWTVENMNLLKLHQEAI